ncbi:hypothetical protein DENSPDRAFT_870709 [Dentipellis sp. KUC8613]|nr:hypothetical protein DENSPDRAFT_870709 [Dentipellis sp. KUC8613]
MDPYATITVDTFFNEFFPVMPTIEDWHRYGNFESLTRDLYDSMTYYKPICKAVNQMLCEVGLNEYVLMFTGDVGENGTEDRLKPSLSLYRKTPAAQAAFMYLGAAQADLDTNLRRGNYRARAAWAWMISIVEMKPAKEYATLSRMVSYATEIQNRQHREFVLMAFIHQAHIRFMRWDRAGVTVSHPVNYVQDPTSFFRFVYCLALADQKKRWGCDPTAELADNGDVNRLRSLYKKLSQEEGRVEDKDGWLQHYLRTILDNRRFHPIYRVFCEDAPGCEKPETTDRRRIYLTGKALHFKQWPIGRATRGYVALDVDRDALVFMKDSWRPNTEDIRSETDIHMDLNAKGVGFVATVLAGGAVGGPKPQHTRSQNFLRVRPEEKLPDLIHHRLVQKEVGRALETYATQKELLVTLYHAFRAHRDAWEKAGILHRNVSASNILIDVRTGHGFLNDWTMCQYKSEMSKDANPYGRYGTWGYMSAALLRFPLKPNQLFDDLESFVHVATIMGLRFHMHDRSAKARRKDGQVVIDGARAGMNQSLANYLRTTYTSSARIEGGFYVGGTRKWLALIEGTPEVVFDQPQHPLPKFIKDLYETFQPFYQSIDKEEYMIKYYPKTTKNEDDVAAETMIVVDDFEVGEPIPKPVPEKPPSQYSLNDMEHAHFNRVWLSLREGRVWPEDDKTLDQFEGLGNDAPISSGKRYLEFDSNELHRSEAPNFGCIGLFEAWRLIGEQASAIRDLIRGDEKC